MSMTDFQRIKGMEGKTFWNTARTTIIQPEKVELAIMDAAETCAVGDLMVLVTDDVRKASTLTDAGTKAQNQEAFHDIFIGIALEAKTQTSTTQTIGIATRGRVRMPAVSAAYEIGQLIGPEGTGASEAVGIANQTLIGVATANLAIGRCCRKSGTATSVDVDFVSTVMYGGPQVLQ